MSKLGKQRAKKVVDFIGHLRHTKGRWAGEPFVLLPWQRKRIIEPLFGTLDAEGIRVYQSCYCEIPRKNGKTTLAAAIALYLLCADGEQGGEVYGAAYDRDQATLVFQTAADMVRRSPHLARRVQIVDSQKRMVYPKTGSVYRAIPADAAGAFGFNASGIIFDELHTQRTRELWDALTTSTGARRQPLVLAITTAGYDRQSICWEQHEHARQVLAKAIQDPRCLPVIYAAGEKDDWTNQRTWKKANPSLGKTITMAYLRDECRKARQTPAYQNTFRRLHLDQWTQQEERWLDLAKWDGCSGAVDPEALRGRECYAGLDLASTTDITALVMVFPPTAEDEGYAVLPRFWVPEAEGLHQRGLRDRVSYDAWARDGFLEVTSGNAIDYRTIVKDVVALGERYRIQEIAFDRWGAAAISTELQDAGFTMVEFGQGFQSMSAPTKELLRLTLGGSLRHGGHPVLRWMSDNMAVSQDPAGNLKPNKETSREKIDGMVALIMALDRAVRHAAGSVYDARGPLLV